MEDIFGEIAAKEAAKREVEHKAAEQLGEGVPLPSDLPTTKAPTIAEIIARPKHRIGKEDAIRKLAALAIESKAVVLTELSAQHTNVARRRIMAVLWMLGGSNRQIAQYFRISVPTLKDHIKREVEMVPENRRFQPTFKEQLPLEELTWYATKLNEASVNVLNGMDAKNLYHWVLSNHPYQGD